MKLTRRFKIVLYLTALALYLSGLITWILETWFKIDRGFGPESRPQAVELLHAHSIVGLWFLIIFGYLYHSHVENGWRAQKKVKSGLTLIIPLIITIITVPGLFYLMDGKIKDLTTEVHVYAGLFLAVPFFTHYLTVPKTRKKVKKARPKR